MNAHYTALQYLRGKYGYRRGTMLPSKHKELSKTHSKKARKVLEDKLTDADFTLIHNEVTDLQDKIIELLLSQYYCGIAAKMELRREMENRGLM